MLETLTHEDFDGRIGDPFVVAGPDDVELTLKLAEVSVTGAAVEGHRTPFALEFFEEGADRHLEQGTFSVEHAELGTFLLFLVPLGPGEAGMRYEAVFG